MRRAIPFAALLVGVFLIGCEDKPSSSDNKSGTKTTTGEAKKTGPKHEGWWCTEHGIPEHECLMCLHSEDELKAKKDWCETHGYAKSQCFGCDPKLKERYAAQYKAKYGKDAPEPDDNPPSKNPSK